MSRTFCASLRGWNATGPPFSTSVENRYQRVLWNMHVATGDLFFFGLGHTGSQEPNWPTKPGTQSHDTVSPLRSSMQHAQHHGIETQCIPCWLNIDFFERVPVRKHVRTFPNTEKVLPIEHVRGPQHAKRAKQNQVPKKIINFLATTRNLTNKHRSQEHFET